MSILFMTDYEAKNYDRIGLFVRPVDLQLDRIRTSPFVKSGIETLHGREVKCPYTAGEKLFCKERYLIEGRCVFYCDDGWIEQPGFSWRSSVTMPQWAVRRRPIVESVRVKRVQEIENNEMLSFGLPAVVSLNKNYIDYFYTNEFKKIFWYRYAGTPYAWEKNPYVWLIGINNDERIRRTYER